MDGDSTIEAFAREGRHPMDEKLRICGHCRQVMRGYASKGDMWLCHPDEGLDCYTAVTLHGHGERCTICDPSLAHTSTWAEVKADMFESRGSRLPEFNCETCGTNLSIPANSTHGVCRDGYCTTALCRGCGTEWASWGPVDCECQGRSKRISKIRAMYRRKGRR